MYFTENESGQTKSFHCNLPLKCAAEIYLTISNCSHGIAVGKQSVPSIFQFHKEAINRKNLFKHVLTFANAHIRETAFAVAFIRIHSGLDLTAVAFNCQVKNYKDRHYSLQKCNKEEKKTCTLIPRKNYLLEIDEISVVKRPRKASCYRITNYIRYMPLK